MFKASAVLLALFERAGVDPHRVNHAMFNRIWSRKGPMSSSDHFPRQLAQANRLPVYNLARRNLHLLVEVTYGNMQYRELTPSLCTVHLSNSLPEDLKYGMSGRTLGELVDFGHAAYLFSDIPIVEPLVTGGDATMFKVDPRGKRFSERGD